MRITDAKAARTEALRELIGRSQSSHIRTSIILDPILTYGAFTILFRFVDRQRDFSQPCKSF